MKTETALVLLFVLLRCSKRGRAAPTGMGNWQPPTDPDGFNVPVIPLPANPLDPNNAQP